MRTILDIYEKYQIMPNLVMHQLRVAAVAKLICENFQKTIDTNGIITACLLHDMGNIIKFRLERFPQFLEPEGLEYWKNVQERYIAKYGTDESLATDAIVRELGISEEVLSYMEATSHYFMEKLSAGTPFEQKICLYADFRVDPHKVVPILERLDDVRDRYIGHTHDISAIYDELKIGLTVLEKNIFEHTPLLPEDISDDMVTETIASLRHFYL